MSVRNMKIIFSSATDSNGNFIEYNVIAGSNFSEEYGETLDSGSVLLSHIPASKRLFQNTKMFPYEFAKVYEGDINNPTFEKFFVVDSYEEQEFNIDRHLFKYTIQLMSETKILEKIQCPNLAITHKLGENGEVVKKPIWQYIEQYMTLFIPKIKYTSDGVTWHYEPLIKMPTGSKLQQFRDRFSTFSADMSLTASTMRQLLTTLMQQVGCIPVVVNRTLGFLDFQVDSSEFGGGDYTVEHTVSHIRRGWSSDSRANHVVKMLSNVLDNSNEVVVETLGFRDKNNPFLKQTENLQLETSFPIYKINEMHMKAVLKGNVKFNNGCDSNSSITNLSGNDYLAISFSRQGLTAYSFSLQILQPIVGINSGDNHKVVTFGLQYHSVDNSYGTFTGTVSFTGKCYFYNSTSKENSQKLANVVRDANGSMTLDSSSTNETLRVSIDCNDIVENYSDFDQAIVVGKAEFIGTFDDGTSYDISSGDLYALLVSPSTYSISNSVFLFDADITPLVVENSIRQTLETNFVNMQNATTVEELSKFVYGTFGFNIGSKTISGFSNMYSPGSPTMFGWITKNYTYVENVFNFFLTKAQFYVMVNLFDQYYSDIFSRAQTYLLSIFTKPQVETALSSAFTFSDVSFYNLFKTSSTLQRLELYSSLVQQNQIEMSELRPDSSQPITQSGGIFPADDLVTSTVTNIFNSNINFGLLFFDIKYQPLNSLNLSYVKDEDTPFKLEQLDGSADGVVDFDRMSISTQEKVERIGNETLTITQRTEDFSQIQPVNSYYRDDFNKDGVSESTKYIIYNKRYRIDNYAYSVSYVGSKDSILKNYFTSIRTKYRAYQYISYNQSVTRKEKDVIYVCISSKGYFNGDDKVFLGTFNWMTGDVNSYDYSRLVSFISGCVIDDTLKPVIASCEYALEQSKTALQMIRNEVSIIATKNIMAFVYEEIDNVGAGPYISVGQMARGGWYGGILQTYQIWDEETYNKDHPVFFVNHIDYDRLFDKIAVSDNNLSTLIRNQNMLLYSPIVGVDNDSDPAGSYTLVNPLGEDVAFAIVDNNKSGEMSRTFYKDYSELINHTVEFVYYTDNKDTIAWTEEFIRRNGFMRNPKKEEYSLRMCGVSSLELDEFEHTVSLRDLIDYKEIGTFCVIARNNGRPSIKVDWTQTNGIAATYIKIVALKVVGTKVYVKDIISFRRPKRHESTTVNYYVSLNDTRSNYVIAEKNGIIYKYDTISYNTNNRTLKNAHAINITTYGIQSYDIARISSTHGAPTGSIQNGDVIYNGDVIQFLSVIPTNMYVSFKIKINGTTYEEGEYVTYTVNGDMDVEISGVLPEI